MIKIAVDCMGSDNGPQAIIEACKIFLKRHDDVTLILSGEEQVLSNVKNIPNIDVCYSTQVVPMEAGAMQVMRMKDSSMMKIFDLASKETIDAFVSAGSTGGFLSLAT